MLTSGSFLRDPNSLSFRTEHSGVRNLKRITCKLLWETKMPRKKKLIERTACLAITHKGDACPATGYKGSHLCYGHWNQRIDSCRRDILDYTYDEVCEEVERALGPELPDFVYAYLRECYSDPINCRCGVRLFPSRAQYTRWANYCPHCGVAFTQQVRDWIKHEENRLNKGAMEARLGR